jgi:hypothetical protein
MKNFKVTLYQWKLDEYPDEYLDIDWPAVHKDCGVDQINWINRQSYDDCQMSLEFFQGGKRLIVEFFNQETLTTYHLMWAK